MQILKANRTTAGLCASLVQILKLLNCLNQCHKQEKEEEVEQDILVDEHQAWIKTFVINSSRRFGRWWM